MHTTDRLKQVCVWIAAIAVAASPVLAHAARARPAARASQAAPEKDAREAPAISLAIRTLADGRIKRFYQSRGYWPLWIHNGAVRPEAAKLIQYLESADLDGLNPRSYDIDRLQTAVDMAADGSPENLARAELRLSQTFASYVSDAKRPSSVRMTYLDAELEPRRLREDDVLRAATVVSSFPAYVRAMGWMNPLYVKLRAGFDRYLSSGRNDPAAERRIRLNLDRARILPGPWTRHIVVDAASARLYYYGAGTQQGMMRVVVGTAETETPMLAGMVRYAILNPYWNVPSDLVQNRIAPRILRGESFTRLRYEALSSWSANATKLDPATIDWRAVANGSQELRVRQRPGGANAMGRMKFMFPNDQGIYLHDTPDKSLMRRPSRHLSNGCVRLEDAPRLGRWMFGRPLTAASTTPEQDVALSQPVPVYLTYLTATPTATGISLLSDPYGRDGSRRR